MQITHSIFTFTFSDAVQSGTFLNGDKWVVLNPGTTLQSVTQADGSPVQCEYNPQDPSHQGLYPTVGYATAYEPARRLSLPFTPPAQPVCSLIAAAHYPNSAIGPTFRAIKEIAVLTFLAAPPVEPTFRPPYSGDPAQKAAFHFRASQLQPNLIAASRPIPALPNSMQYYVNYFSKVQYEYYATNKETGQGNLSASSSVQGAANTQHTYGIEKAAVRSEAVLAALDTSKSLEERKTLIYELIQVGIDNYYSFKHGKALFIEGGGHGHGHWLMILFASLCLANEEMFFFCRQASQPRNTPNAIDGFSEWHSFYKSSKSGQVLFGLDDQYGQTYWNNLAGAQGANFWANKDPEEEIDGCKSPGTSYMATISASISQAIATASFNDLMFFTVDPLMVGYVCRYATRGAITLPDSKSHLRPIMAQYDRNRGYSTQASSTVINAGLALIGAPNVNTTRV